MKTLVSYGENKKHRLPWRVSYVFRLPVIPPPPSPIPPAEPKTIYIYICITSSSDAKNGGLVMAKSKSPSWSVRAVNSGPGPSPSKLDGDTTRTSTWSCRTKNEQPKTHEPTKKITNDGRTCQGVVQQSKTREKNIYRTGGANFLP